LVALFPRQDVQPLEIKNVKYRNFGRSGWQVSEIGFGAWQIGGDWALGASGQTINRSLQDHYRSHCC
jgi:hypothetical protein